MFFTFCGFGIACIFEFSRRGGALLCPKNACECFVFLQYFFVRSVGADIIRPKNACKCFAILQYSLLAPTEKEFEYALRLTLYGQTLTADLTSSLSQLR